MSRLGPGGQPRGIHGTHDGLDFAAPAGTEVVSASFGKVLTIHNDKQAGLTVLVEVPGTDYTLVYAHLSASGLGGAEFLTKTADIQKFQKVKPGEANRLKFQIQRQHIETKGSELEAQAKIVLAEAQGSWLQGNWRPLLMVIFAGLVVAHWFGFTASNIPESVQNSLLNIVMVGVGGYVMGRSAEKVVNKWQ